MPTRREWLRQTIGGVAAFSTVPSLISKKESPPNIVFILADDVGYGDLVCYGATHVQTPNLDRLAHEGVRFTDAHSTAAVCTPTRYSLLTGQYAWRNPAAEHILSGVAPLSISPKQPTIASLLKQAGYKTGVVGKWHLGLGTQEKLVDFNIEIKPGPLDIGFDYAFIIPATGDRVPCVFIENREVIGKESSDPIEVRYDHKVGDDPTGLEHPELLKIKADESHSKTIVNGISRIGYMTGGNKARWIDEEIADTLTTKAQEFIKDHQHQPFFLYLATHDIHEPMVPHPRFRGTSKCGTRGDVIQELDWTVGQVIKTLDELGLTEKTLVIFASDNGGAIKDTYDDGTNPLHSLQPPNGTLRGQKGTLYEGGHRIPFIARWPGHTQAGTVSDSLIGLVDMPATLAALAGVGMDQEAAPDSFNVLPSILGEDRTTPPRNHLVLQANGPEQLALRQANWKLLAATEGTMRGELYDLVTDPTEARNLFQEQPEKVAEMTGMLNRIRNGRQSRP